MVLLGEIDAMSAVWGGVVTLFVNKLFDWLTLRETNRQLRAVGPKLDAATASLQNVGPKIDAVVKDAKVTRSAAQATANVAVETATAHGEALARVEQGVASVELNTNGRLEAKERENAALRAQIAAMLKAEVPPVVTKTLPKLAEDVGHLVAVIDGAEKSGVFKVPQPRDPATRERRDDR